MKILIPLDGSKLAEDALDLAAGLARLWSGELVVVRVVGPSVAIPAGAPGLAMQVEKVAREEACDYLETIARQLTRWGMAGATRALFGQAVEQIVREAEEEGVGLICMASHGRSGPARWLLGSVAEGAVRKSPCPVLLCRGEIGSDFQGFRQVIVPVDGSRGSAEVIQKVKPYLHPTAHLTLVRASEDLVRHSALRLDQVSYQGYLDALEEELKALDPEERFGRRVLDCPAAEAIMTLAQEKQADLIAMATHGRSGMQRLVLGSVTERVARHASCPVLAFPLER
ncbi:universal stress protein [bacterium CPR1]|nr:universal stress protein [bacterium CPR1]